MVPILSIEALCRRALEAAGQNKFTTVDVAVLETDALRKTFTRNLVTTRKSVMTRKNDTF